MFQQEKNVALVKDSSEAVWTYCNTPVQNEKTPVQPQQNEKSIESRDKACLVRTKEARLVRTEARKRYLASLREAYAQKVFSKFLNELSGTLTMKNHKGTWHLVFSCGHENDMVQAKGKTLANALINLATKSPLTSPLTPEGGMQPSEQNSTKSKSPLSFGEGWGEEFKTVAL